MAARYIQQPNGKWAIYSTITDSLTDIEFTEEQLIEHVAEMEKERIQRTMRMLIDNVKTGFMPPRILWKEAVQDTRKRLKKDNIPDCDFARMLDEIGEE